ncbi:3-hydroxybutyrate dehydrogenase [Ruegeria halocynthiae]|uniref:3-hydroxybutyrate dehydrogenase n=1 Tax=Ruegeria halocynthiae TaxID=985054 RepID=A0A1H3EJG7_9RHOB|nr:SDR family oxidoreductase [Ruegeria halocynthiae]SDX78735.1 3-hydroxybutyrate dehydrogenase [Ruegeria halocynthiae]
MGAELSGKHVVVTGANRGIGLGLAQGFLEAGAEVTIVAFEDDVQEVAERLYKDHGKAVGHIKCDISDLDQVKAMCASFDQVDVLINNAGFEYITPIDDPADHVDEVFRQIIETNVIGTFSVTRYLLDKIPDGGRIVNSASMWGKTAVSEFSAYCASKHAVIGLTRSLAQELAPRGISVNAVCPGWVRTVASMRSLAFMAARQDRTEVDLLDEIVSAQALGGLMEPSDMVAMYVFLSGPAAANITGQSFTVDRGELMQ